MKIIKEFTLIIGILLLAHLIQGISQLPVPATVLGMILLLLGLLTKIIKPKDIENVSKFLLDNLTLLFIPGGVGIILSIGLLRESWLSIFLVLIITSLIGLSVTGLTVKFMKTIEGRRENE